MAWREFVALRGTYAVVRKIARLNQAQSAEWLAEKVFNAFPSLYHLLPAPGHSAGLDLFDAGQWPQSGPRPRTRLLAAARRSLERTGGQLTGRISVADPDDAERKAIIGITGVHQPAGTRRMTVPLADVDAALSRATGLGLAGVLAALGAPAQPARRDRLAGRRPRWPDRGGPGQFADRVLSLVPHLAD